MQVYNDLFSIKKDENTVVTIGTFDGIHLGHQEIIEKVRKKAVELRARSFLVTFNPHPRNVLTGQSSLKVLSTLNEKEQVLEKLGIENLFVINFTKEFSQLPAEKFFSDYIINGIGLKEIVIGYDFRFGRGRGGGIETLIEMGEKNNFKVYKVGEVALNKDKISSTEIRKALTDGNIRYSNELLGRYYSFSGIVVHGDNRGRALGFPTANIKIDDEDKLLPALGIYVVEFFVKGNKYYGLLSVGKRPTFYNEGNIIPEVYVYDFDEDIYDEFVTVNVIERLRGEEKFSSVENLVIQMNKDKEAGLEILRKI
ncbi:MAG: riboflavin biosynthesis protein RibF [Ignavibacteria bacterium RBG_16_34_14]|nr:MAG: riboflavin biosynthesis protein RibF [Ignavibacteria bacterium RBG_16_34_14]